MAENLTVHYSREEILVLQQETTEARNFLKENPPIFPIDDMAATIGYAEKGGSLSPLQLASIAYFINSVEELILFFRKSEAKSLILKQKGENLHSFQPLYHVITRCIDENGEVLDTASEKLASLRRKIAVLQLRIHDALEKIIHSPQTRKYLQDPIITTRSDRYVVPVKSEYKSFLKGIVHDRSASGATLFIEPLKVVELNNELNGLKKEEEIEIERILADLSARVSKSASALRGNYANYCYIDAVFSRARLSADMD
ncbi:MAG TPA: endonuclease MutS2, partial [Firmicutes bacterium]|nr:endonuclease MutS2 [Bacillota bacterium]